MQQIAYIKVADTSVKVLAQSRKYGVSLKLRKGQEEGRLLEDESLYLDQHPEKLLLLMQGKTITL